MHEIVIIVAKYFLVLSLLGSLYVWLKLNREQKKIFILEGIVGGILALVFAVIGSKLYHDPRPFVVGHFTPYFAHGNDNGFPSDHTLLTSLLAFLVMKYSKAWGWALLAIAVLVGLARVIAGVHHLADIIGSIIFAGVGVQLARILVRRFYSKTVAADVKE